MSKIQRKKLQVVGIGACVMDTLLTVPLYPKEDTKVRALSGKLAGGGPVATGLTAAARLGISSGYIGWLADDSAGDYLMEDFRKYGVDTGCVDQKAGYRGFTSVVWLAEDRASRTCVFDKGNVPPLILDDRKRQAIADAEVLMIDGNEMIAAGEACRVAKENGTKVLYDCGSIYEGAEKLLAMTDVMIPSEEFALEYTGCNTVFAAAVSLYERYHPETVVITCGEKGGVWYDGRTQESYSAFCVNAVDTNGAGDVFHGAFAAGMVKGLDFRKCCVFASAVSAVKCTGFGARESVPDEETVRLFLKERGYGEQNELFARY